MPVSDVTEISLVSLEAEKSKLENLTYAIVDKKKMEESAQSQENASEKWLESVNTTDPEEAEEPKKQASQKQGNIEEMVLKQPKSCEEQEPPVPSHIYSRVSTHSCLKQTNLKVNNLQLDM